MNYSVFVALAVSFLSTFSVTAQERDRNYDPTGKKQPLSGRQLFVQQEWIELSTIDLTNLLFAEKLERSDDELRADLEKLIQANKAKVIESIGLVVAHFDSTSSRNVSQSIHPTEFDPAEIYPRVTDKDGNQIDKERILPPTPTAFEERDIGITNDLDASASLLYQSLIALSVKSELNSEHGKNILTHIKTEGVKHTIYTPRFTTWQVETQLNLSSGKHRIVAVYSAKDQNGKLLKDKKVIHFIKANIVSYGK